MASTQLQNSQRAVVFLELIFMGFSLIFLVMKLVRKQIDNPNPHASLDEGSKAVVAEVSVEHFAAGSLAATHLHEDDTCSTRAIKKFYEFITNKHVLFLPIWLSFVGGSTFWFALTVFSIGVSVSLFVNVYKIHRVCFDHIVFRVLWESLEWIAALILLLNLWVYPISPMVYTITQA